MLIATNTFYLNASRRFSTTSRGCTRSIHDGRSDVFFWVENLHARYFFGSRDLSRIFLGLKKYAYFFGSLKNLRANFSFGVFVAIIGSEKYSFEGG